MKRCKHVRANYRRKMKHAPDCDHLTNQNRPKQIWDNEMKEWVKIYDN